ncbi:MAG: alginate export family protein, partial [Bacteroidota bacterium]
MNKWSIRPKRAGLLWSLGLIAHLYIGRGDSLVKRQHGYTGLFMCLLLCGFTCSTFAQISFPLNEERAKEDYTFLKDSTALSWPATLKYLPLNAERSAYLSIGGSFRPRFEHFTNRNWASDNNENYYSQRLTFHTDWHLGKYLRFFGEVQHGHKTDGATFLQTDDLDWHQGFVEGRLPIQNNQLTFRFGRQEMKLGGGRLIDLRVGPNIRRSFDMGKISFDHDRVQIDAFYGKEVQIGFDAFDNPFNLFEGESGNPKLWGINSRLAISPKANKDRNTDIYYIGFQSDQSAYSDVVGEEIRHSIGIRSFGTIKHRFQYNTELIYQFGDIGGIAIRAFNFETDWKYTLIHQKWKPTLGLKLDWSSGDGETGDDRLNSFNPLFVNPGIYSLAAVNTPVNLLSIHPAFIFFPSKKLLVNIEFAAFFRSSKEDGLYAPPRFQTRPADGIADNHIGNTVGLFVKYTYNQHASFDIRSSYFIAGDFIEAEGPDASIKS